MLFSRENFSSWKKLKNHFFHNHSSWLPWVLPASRMMFDALQIRKTAKMPFKSCQSHDFPSKMYGFPCQNFAHWNRSQPTRLPRGRWRRSRNLRRVPTTEEKPELGEGPKISPLRRTFEDPSFGVFSWNCLYNRIGPTQNASKKKYRHRHQTDIRHIWADLLVGWIPFSDTLNALIARRSPQKRVPNQAPRFS